MGKKKIDKIAFIKNTCQRKVTYCKRKKGLLKKAIELSMLCDLKMFIFMYDKSQKRVIHYASDANQDFMEIFNQKNQREYYTNKDFHRVGGNQCDIDTECHNSDDNSNFDHHFNGVGCDLALNEFQRKQLAPNWDDQKTAKIFSKKRQKGNMTSRLGDLLSQKLAIPDNFKQVVTLMPETPVINGPLMSQNLSNQMQNNQNSEDFQFRTQNQSMVILPNLTKESKDMLSKMKNTWNLSEEKRKMLEFGNDETDKEPQATNSHLGKRSFDQDDDIDNQTILSNKQQKKCQEPDIIKIQKNDIKLPKTQVTLQPIKILDDNTPSAAINIAQQLNPPLPKISDSHIQNFQMAESASANPLKFTPKILVEKQKQCFFSKIGAIPQNNKARQMPDYIQKHPIINMHGRNQNMNQMGGVSFQQPIQSMIPHPNIDPLQHLKIRQQLMQRYQTVVATQPIHQFQQSQTGNFNLAGLNFANLNVFNQKQNSLFKQNKQ